MPVLAGRAAACILAAFIGAPAAWADCVQPYENLFTCDIPERSATVQFCRIFGDNPEDLPEYRYSYGDNGTAELVFTTRQATSTAVSGVWGIPGTAITTAYVNGQTVYAAFVPFDEHEYRRSAVVLVYKDMDSYVNEREKGILARRSCYPPSIVVNQEWFGPG
ncbi:hypothetical protein [Paracoccus sp. SSK6]|uniref:hypothetical protein n=1 Tax=Paracoccus sp. SSK6 TaxID=3143131 RepID=UPI00321BE9A5